MHRGLFLNHLKGNFGRLSLTPPAAGYRVLYVMIERDLMIWLHAFVKKTQKTSKQDLDLARKRLKEVLR